MEYQVHVAANVDQIVARLIGTREVSPENKMVHRIFDSMVQRGLIERRAERQRVLHVFHLTRIKYQFPDSTVSVLNSQLAREAIRLLNEAERNRPDLYAKLVDSVQLGFWRQTNRSD